MDEEDEERLHEAVETVGVPSRFRSLSLSPPPIPSFADRAFAEGPGLGLGGLGVSPMDTKERPEISK